MKRKKHLSLVNTPDAGTAVGEEAELVTLTMTDHGMRLDVNEPAVRRLLEERAKKRVAENRGDSGTDDFPPISGAPLP